MALIICPECGKEVSDKATNCIHCGYPLEVQRGQHENTDVDRIAAEADNLRANGRYAEALTFYEKAATLNHDRSQLWLGNFYERGLGVAVDYAKARSWFEKAAAQNNAAAISNLGHLHEKGLGVPQNIPKAIELYKKASDLGNATASGNLASIYYFGRDVDVNYSSAVYYYTTAIKQGAQESPVYNNLGVCYMDGKGTTVDYQKAEELLTKAIGMGNGAAKENLDILRARISKKNQTVESASTTSAKKHIIAPANAQKAKKKHSTFWVAVVVLALIGLLIMGVGGNDDKDRTCAWCNGTGYNGNGAQTVEEYVFSKTPCTHCDGKGTY